MAWAHSQCHGDWVLRLDGDEVVSAALLSSIRRLIARRDVLQYYIPCRWLFPDATRWLNELPWFPDYHNRLVRNDGTLWFEGTPHSSAYQVLPARYLEAPIYHLNLLLLSERERMAKMGVYEGRRPGMLAPGGGSVNRYYLPERYARIAPSPVPPEDIAAIRAVLDATVVAASSTSGALPVARRDEIDRWWNWRQPPPEAYRARLEPLERDHRMVAGEGRLIHLKITNLGVETWPWAICSAPRSGFRTAGLIVTEACAWPTVYVALFPVRLVPANRSSFRPV
jgi:hypothetical protein